ncbi:MAG: DUF7450 family protein [Actinomycetota bacterium]
MDGALGRRTRREEGRSRRATLAVVAAAIAGIAVVQMAPTGAAIPAPTLPMDGYSKDIRTYFLFALDELNFKGSQTGTTIIPGNVGVNKDDNNANPAPALNVCANGSVLFVDGTQAVADTARMGSGCSFYDLYVNTQDGSATPTVRNGRGLMTPGFFQPDDGDATSFEAGELAAFPNFGCPPGVFVNSPTTRNDTVTPGLAPGVYGNTTPQGGTLTLGPGVYTFCKLNLDGGTLITDPNTEIRIVANLTLGNGASFGSSPLTKVFIKNEVLQNNNDRTSTFSRNATVNGQFWAPFGQLNLGHSTQLAGNFWAQTINSDFNINEGTTTTTVGGSTTIPTTTSSTSSTSTTSTTIAGSTTTTTIPDDEPDHYLCYTTNARQTFTVTLSDQFETGSYSSFHQTVLRFCTPADKNDEGISDPDTHYTAIRIRGPHVPRKNLRIDNQFGTLFVDTTGTETLLVPTNKSLVPAPPPASPALGTEEHFRCVRVKIAAGAAPFQSRTVQVDDQFGNRSLRITRPATLCAPADKNGEGIIDPVNHLLCYKAFATPVHKVEGAQGANQFGNLVMKLGREDELCVPSTKTLPDDGGET